ncbi:phage polarity suppression protein, partial [Citrobacter sp. RHB21-C01]|uniref:phage polarity suppression protein n=1 Tax=Citrobacter sp. RHB21-C01 TaxID=2742622 RepID=UPI0034D5872D
KDILTAIGYRPDAPSRDDNREKFTPAQNMIYARRRAGLAARSLSKNPCKSRYF